MRKTSVLIGLGLVLSACGNTPAPGGGTVGALSGAFLPAKIGVGGQLNLADLHGHTQEVKLGTSVTLVNGHLPDGVFAGQKSDIATAVNNSALLSSADKAKLIAGANDALDQFAAAINSALDDLPRQMSVEPGTPVGDVAWATFKFTPASKPAFSLGGFYNVKNTDYSLGGVTFIKGGSNSQGGVLTVSACDFKGQLTTTVATLRCGTDTLAIVNSVGALNLALGLQVDLNFTRN